MSTYNRRTDRKTGKFFKTVAIGGDHGGFLLKQQLSSYLRKKGFIVSDFGTRNNKSCDYPIFAARVAEVVSNKKIPRGILICKSGLGNSMVANKFPGVRAALCFNIKSARLSRQHNDSNIIVFGSNTTNFKKAKAILDAWLSTDFEGGRHARRINLIEKLEKKLFRKR